MSIQQLMVRAPAGAPPPPPPAIGGATAYKFTGYANTSPSGGITLNPDGTLNPFGYFSGETNWYRPTTPAIGNGYWMQLRAAQIFSNTVPFFSGAGPSPGPYLINGSGIFGPIPVGPVIDTRSFSPIERLNASRGASLSLQVTIGPGQCIYQLTFGIYADAAGTTLVATLVATCLMDVLPYTP